MCITLRTTRAQKTRTTRTSTPTGGGPWPRRSALSGAPQRLHECVGGLELHHAHIEFALQNGVELAWLEADYPGVSDPDTIGMWVESAKNLTWLCERHHRGDGGVHTLTASDYEAEKYVKGLTSGTP